MSCRAAVTFAVTVGIAGVAGIVGFQKLEAAPPASVDWKQRWEELCSYDDRHCHHLKNPNGTFKEPKREIVEVLKALQPKISKAATDLGVDPRAVSGAVLAENTLNVQISDTLQDFLVATKLAGDGKILGKSFSFGLGQINIPAAMEGEELLAKHENRSVRSTTEVAQELLNPEAAVRYVAAIVRVCQDAYQEKGLSIAGQPQILASLYNMGKCRERAERTKSKGENPKPNYFGFFVEKHLAVIEDTVKPRPKDEVQLPPLPFGYGITRHLLGKKYPAEVAGRDLILAVAPNECQSSGSGEQAGEKNRVETARNAPPSGVVRKGSEIEMVSPGVGCGMSEWSLIRTKNGVTGWIADSILKKNISREWRDEPSSCDPPKDAKTSQCKKEMKEVAKLKPLVENDFSWSVRIIAEEEEPSWKRANSNCMFADEREKDDGPKVGQQTTLASKRKLTKSSISKTVLPQGGLGMIGGIYPGLPGSGATPVSLESAEIDELLKKIELKRTSLLEAVNRGRAKRNLPALDSWKSPENPYRAFFDSGNLSMLSANLEQCRKSKLMACSPVDPQAIGDLLAFENKEAPTYADLKELESRTGKLFINLTMGMILPGSAEEKGLQKKFAEMVDACKKASENLPESRKIVDHMDPHVKGGVSGLILSSGELDAKLQACRDLNFAWTEKIDEQALRESGCRLTLFHPLGNNINYGGLSAYSTVRLSLDVFKATLHDPADRDLYLSSVLGNGQWHMYLAPAPTRNIVGGVSLLNANQFNFPGQTFGNGPCPYNPDKTVTLIEAILENDCVDAVFVPDPWLVKKLNQQGDRRIFYRPFVEEDRFLVEWKHQEGCRVSSP